MSYDISLVDKDTKETLYLDEPHGIKGGTYALGGTRECWLNITYNYSGYFSEAADGDERFREPNRVYHYADERGDVEDPTPIYGIRGLYGKTARDSLLMLCDLRKRIKDKYYVNGKWKDGERTKIHYFDSKGNEIDDIWYWLHLPVEERVRKEEKYTVSEGDTDNYWEVTAANAIKSIDGLIELAILCPDGVWEGD